jgi:hypothetical protein
MWGDEQLTGLLVLLVPTVSPKHTQSVSAGQSVLQQGKAGISQRAPPVKPVKPVKNPASNCQILGIGNFFLYWQLVFYFQKFIIILTIVLLLNRMLWPPEKRLAAAGGGYCTACMPMQLVGHPNQPCEPTRSNRVILSSSTASNAVSFFLASLSARSSATLRDLWFTTFKKLILRALVEFLGHPIIAVQWATFPFAVSSGNKARSRDT